MSEHSYRNYGELVGELEYAILEILAEGEIITPDDQKEVAEAIAELLSPPYLTKLCLKAVIEQVESCGFTCGAGPLEKNEAWLALKELSVLP